MMKVRYCSSYIAVRSLLIGQFFLEKMILRVIFCLLIGQSFLAHGVILVLEMCLNLSYLETDVSKLYTDHIRT